MGKTLIAYYSRAGENIANGMTVMLSEGNTEVAAKYISEFVEADMFRIEQAVPYSDNYTDCTAQAKLDQSTNARPELKASLESIADYDTIYLGFPNYWGTMPMAVFTFLEQFDFTGKKIKPFVTHEGSGFGTAVGYTIAIVLLAGIRSRINEKDLPAPLRGAPIVMIAAALMSIAFMGFGGLQL